MERNDIEEHEYQELFSISRSPPSQQVINNGSWNEGQQHQAADNTVTIVHRKEATRALYITLIVAVIIIISLVVLICVIVVVFIPTKAPAGVTTAGNANIRVSTTAPAGATTAGNGKVTVSTTAPAGATTAAPAGATTAGNGKVTVSTTAPAGATTAGNGKVTVSTTTPAGATTAGNGKVTVSTTTPAGATTADPFSCASRATGDNIPREYTHPSHCKEYYWCVNGASINRTCPGSSFFIANATQSLACTSDYTLSFCALKSSSSPPAGATTAGNGKVAVSTRAPPSKCDCSTYAYIARANTYPGNCSQYYWCVIGMKFSVECGSGQQVYFNISEDSLPCTNIASDSYCKHVEDGKLQPCA